MGATHDSNITITISLEAAPPSVFGFNQLYVAETDITERVRVYESPKDVADDEDISSAIKAGLTTAFAQQPRPSRIKLGKKLVGETYVEALDAVVEDDPDFYGINVDSRDAADHVLVGAWSETRPKLFIGQSAVADWLTSGKPAAYSDIADNERTAIIFHDTAAQYADVGWKASRLVFDPDTQSVPWDTQIRGVAAYASAITAGQRNFALANDCNLMLPYGSAPAFVDAGTTLAGRSIDEIVTADWFQLRLEQKIAQAKINASARGEKIPLGVVGVSILRPIVESQFAEGVAAGHFVEEQTSVTFITPTQTDIDLGRIRATGRAQLVRGARIFDFSFNFQRTAITEEA